MRHTKQTLGRCLRAKRHLNPLHQGDSTHMMQVALCTIALLTHTARALLTART